MSPTRLLARISVREQIMLGSLVLVGFMIWGSVLLRHWENLSDRHKQLRGELNKQAIWLGDTDRFKRELDQSLSLLDPELTLNAEALVGLVDELAREGGLPHDLGVLKTDNQKVLVKHSLNVGIQNAKLRSLIDFERKLRDYYPHVAFDDFSISANKSDPRLLNARLTLVSYQLNGKEKQK